jgi:hypothetical protein
MGNTTTHTHYTTSNTSSPPHPSTPHDPNPTAPSNNSHTPNAVTPARTTIAQRARTQHPYPNHIPNRYDRHFQRDFDPDAAFQHLFRHTLHDVPDHHPYCVALDGTTVPRTGASHPRRPLDTQPRQRPVRARTAQRPTLHEGRLARQPPRRPLRAHLLAAHLLPQSPLCQPHLAPLRNSKAGLPACSGCARGSTPQDAQSSYCCVSATGGAIPKRWARWMLPNTVCCVRTRKDSRWCALPQGTPSGRGRRRVYSDQVWTPQDKWQQRTGWQRVPLTVRGRKVHLRVKVEGPCRRVGWGERVFFLIIVRGHSQAHQAGQVARADGVLGSRGFGRGGRLAVACAVGGVGVEVVAALGAGGGVSLDEEWVWVG